MKQALDLALEVSELTAQKDAKLFEREGYEAVFTDAMGSMLKDGYWNNSNYTVGQEQFLYDDAVSLMKEMCYPSVTYTVSKAALKDDAEPFMQYRIYDPELGVNDVVHVKKVVSHPDDESKDSVEITNESLSLRSVSFDSI